MTGFALLYNLLAITKEIWWRNVQNSFKMKIHEKWMNNSSKANKTCWKYLSAFHLLTDHLDIVTYFYFFPKFLYRYRWPWKAQSTCLLKVCVQWASSRQGWDCCCWSLTMSSWGVSHVMVSSHSSVRMFGSRRAPRHYHWMKAKVAGRKQRKSLNQIIGWL